MTLSPPGRLDFFSLSRPELAERLLKLCGAPSFRSDQLYAWVYQKQERRPEHMSNLARQFRQEISNLLSFDLLPIRECKLSSDGTRKYLFEVSGGELIESVMIKQPKRMTLCISSQAGCAMRCGFCRTGLMGLKRNLTASEIVRQVVSVIEDSGRFGDMFQNIVFMGMGEPLHNRRELFKALAILGDPRGLSISGRRITVSTSGLVPAIDELGKSGINVNLAISLNATTDEVRSQIMPINRKFKIEELLASLRRFPLKRRKRITIEYVLLKGVNDSPQDLKRLPTLLHGIPVKINVIPYNPCAEIDYEAPDRDTVLKWQEQLLKKGIEASVRWSKGADILAACGQLAAKAQLGSVHELKKFGPTLS